MGNGLLGGRTGRGETGLCGADIDTLKYLERRPKRESESDDVKTIEGVDRCET